MRWFSFPRTRNAFLAIFVVAAVLRFWNLGGPDMFTDEVYYALRGIGYLDYIGSTLQSTPLFWFNPLPAWTQLSMHDHPPLVFLVEHVFFGLFGVSVFVARLPSVLAGLGSVVLVYLIGRKMFGEPVGLVAAGTLAVGSLSVWVSRTALMEPITMALILLTWYLFLLALERERNWYWWGAALGVSFLAKYTAFPLLGIGLVYLLVFRRAALKNFRLYVGLLIALALFSPVIIYNVMLFKTTGHFDLQLAALLKQSVPEWQTLTQKESASYWGNFVGILWGLLDVFSPAMLALMVCGAVYSVWQSVKKSASHFLLIAFLVFYTALLVVIKPLPRFLTYDALFAPVFVAVFWVLIFQRFRGQARFVVVGIFALWGVYELAFSINTNILPISMGPANVTWSLVRPYTDDFGINKLDGYLNGELAGKSSAGVPASGNENLDKIIADNLKRYAPGKQPEKILIVYDTHLHEVTTLWNFDRRYIYEGWPTSFVDDFSKMVDAKGVAYFQGYGIYYVTGTSYSLWRKAGTPSAAAANLERQLVAQGVAPIEITNGVGLPVFKVYRFGL